MKLSVSAAIALVSVLVIGYFAWSDLGPENTRRENGTSPSLAVGSGKAPQSTGTLSSGASTSMKPGQLTNAQRPPGLSWANWSTRDNLKALYDEKRNTVASDPEAAFYLHGILRSCMTLLHEGHDKSVKRYLHGKFSPDIEAARVAMFERQWNSCAGFEGMPMAKAEAENKELAAIGEANGNAQFAARKIARAKKENDPAFDAKVIALLESGDAAVLVELSPLAATNPALKQSGGGTPAASEKALWQAWMMAACDAGYDCYNLFVPNFCIGNGVCTATDYADGVRLTALSPVEYEIANQLRLKIGNAIRGKDWTQLGFKTSR